jgi:hypothetical protein
MTLESTISLDSNSWKDSHVNVLAVDWTLWNGGKSVHSVGTFEATADGLSRCGSGDCCKDGKGGKGGLHNCGSLGLV